MDRPDHTSYIEELSLQMEMLYSTVERVNKHFWPVLLDANRHLNARPEYFSHGSLEETQLVVQHSIDLWIETPGALKMIKARVEGRTSGVDATFNGPRSAHPMFWMLAQLHGARLP